MVSAISTLGMYYLENPEKLSRTKKYLLKKVGYDADNIQKIRAEGVSEDKLSELIETQVERTVKKYFPEA